MSTQKTKSPSNTRKQKKLTQYIYLHDNNQHQPTPVLVPFTSRPNLSSSQLPVSFEKTTALSSRPAKQIRSPPGLFRRPPPSPHRSMGRSVRVNVVVRAAPRHRVVHQLEVQPEPGDLVGPDLDGRGAHGAPGGRRQPEDRVRRPGEVDLRSPRRPPAFIRGTVGRSVAATPSPRRRSSSPRKTPTGRADGRERTSMTSRVQYISRGGRGSVRF